MNGRRQETVLPHPPNASLMEKQDVFPKDPRRQSIARAGPGRDPLWGRQTRRIQSGNPNKLGKNNRQEDQEGMGIICLFLIEVAFKLQLCSRKEKKKKTVFFKVTHEQFLASIDTDQNKLQLWLKNHFSSKDPGTLNSGSWGTGGQPCTRDVSTPRLLDSAKQ